MFFQRVTIAKEGGEGAWGSVHPYYLKFLNCYKIDIGIWTSHSPLQIKTTDEVTNLIAWL